MSSDITALVNALGPEIYDELNSTRVGNSDSEHEDETTAVIATGINTGDDKGQDTLTSLASSCRGGLRDRIAGTRKAIQNRLQGEKYFFPPLTPRSMAAISQISPWDFFGAVDHSNVNNASAGGCTSGSGAYVDSQSHMGSCSARTPAPPTNGKDQSPSSRSRRLFDFDWSDTSDLLNIPGGGDDDVFFFRASEDSIDHSIANSNIHSPQQSSVSINAGSGLKILGHNPHSNPSSMTSSRNASSASLSISSIPPMTSLSPVNNHHQPIEGFVRDNTRDEPMSPHHHRSQSMNEYKSGSDMENMLSTFNKK